MPFLDQCFSELRPFPQQLGGGILRSELLSSCFSLVCVCVSDGGSITFYRPAINPDVILFRKIFPDCKYPTFFLRFAAGIADDRLHDKTTNTDSRRCGLPGDWVLSRCLAAPAHTATLSRSLYWISRIQPVLVFRSTVTEGSGSVWVVSLDVAQN